MIPNEPGSLENTPVLQNIIIVFISFVTEYQAELENPKFASVVYPNVP